jgi:hypothetical protein
MEKFKIHLFKTIPIIERLVYPKFIAAIMDNELDTEIEMHESVYIAAHIDAAIVEANEYISKHYLKK